MRKFLLLASGLLWFLCSVVQAQQILYVDSAAGGANDGSSWVNAYTYLNDALSAANTNLSIREIHVAEGTYFPTGTPTATNRNRAFVITRRGLKLMGGYPSGGGQRNWLLHPTILSGDIGASGSDPDNSLHILILQATLPGSDSLLIDGFTIRNGYANEGGQDTISGLPVPGNQGAGMYVHAVNTRLHHLVVTQNHATWAGAGIALIRSKINTTAVTVAANHSDSLAGGIYLTGGQSTFSSLRIVRNSALLGGGILADTGSRPLVVHAVIKGNTATSKGAGWYNAPGAVPKLFNVLISGNKATYVGSGWYSENNDSVLLMQATIAGNKADYNGGGAVHMGNHDTFENVCLINSIVWGNAAEIVGGVSLSHTIVENGSGNAWNLDPAFVDPVAEAAAPDTGGNYRLTPCSPARNMGDNSLLPSFLNTDLAGYPRIYDSIVDLGCYELQTEPFSSHRLYVDSSQLISGDGQSWNTAFKTLPEALATASECESVDSILVAKGTYYPTTGTNRDRAFVLPAEGLHLIGGYPPGGGVRSFSTYKTILSGDIGLPGDTTDNSYHVVIIAGASDSIIVDGFYIGNGTANGTGAADYHTVSVSRDKGAGIYLTAITDSVVVIRNSSLFHNQAVSGAGMYLSNAFSTLLQVIITGNQAWTRGGGLYAYSGALFAVNCLISGNRAGIQAGAIYNNNNSSLQLINSTVSGNQTLSGNTGGIYNTASSEANLQNSLIYGNSGEGLQGGTSYRAYSLIQGWAGGTNGNMNGNIDPLFTQPVAPLLAPTTSGDYQLLPCSPVINEGNLLLLPQSVLQDLGQQTRVFDGEADPGAYELQQEAGLPSDTLVHTICNGDSFLFQGGYYHLSGFYADTLPTGGCDSLLVLHLTVLPQPVLLPVQAIDGCQQISFEGQIYISDTLLTDTIPFVGFSCDSIYRQIAIHIYQPDSSFIDTTICNGMTVQLGGQTFDSSGWYPVIFSTATGCDSTVWLELTVLPLSDTGISATICAGDSYYFNGQNLSVAGQYADTITSSFGCDSLVVLTLNVLPTLSDSVTVSICNGSSYPFGGQNLSTGGIYYDTLLSTTGCDSLVVLYLSVLPPAQSLTIDTSGCGQVVFDGVTYGQSTLLVDTLTNSMGCDSLYKTVTITVWDNTPATGSLDSGNCHAVFYKGITYFNDTTFIELFRDIHGCDSFLQTVHIQVFASTHDTLNASICRGGYFLFAGEKYDSAGTYTAVYPSQNGCDSIKTLNLTVYELPTLQIHRPLQPSGYCIGDEITLQASGAMRYHWWDENGKDYGYTESVRIRLMQNKTVIGLRGYDAQNCAATKQIILNADACCSVFVPSAFSPNGDGLNDHFGPETKGHPQNFRMRIFSRYGKLIFITDNIRDQWDGTIQGQPAETGVYHYLITGNCTDGRILKESGTVVLIR